MKIIRDGLSREVISIGQFAKQHGLIMRVTLLPPDLNLRYSAGFEHSKLKDGCCCLRGADGRGNSEREAIANCASRITHQTLVIDAMSNTERREIKVPILTSDYDEDTKESSRMIAMAF